MKWIKKIIQGFLFLFLTSLIVTLTLSYSLKSLLLDDIVIETITSKITNKDYKEGNIIFDEEIENMITDERVKEFLKTPEIQELVEKYVNITLDAMTEEETIDEIELEKDILDYISDNKEVISEVVGEKVTDEMIEKTKDQMQGKDMSKSFKQTIKNMQKNMTKEEKRVIKGYRIATSSTFQFIILGLIGTTLLAIAILQKSFTNWINTLGKAMTVSGIMVLIMSIVVSKIVSSATEMKSFKMNSLSIRGLILFAIGITIILVYYLIMRWGKKKYEVS